MEEKSRRLCSCLLLHSLKTKMTLENHHIQQEIHLQIVVVSIVMLVVRGCNMFFLEGPERTPEKYQSEMPTLVMDIWVTFLVS